ncbi:MAG: hypothetical protein JO241_03525 [Candidatus Eremiobacteraeota bacterium]|nr:hypothetical protein [Candidatus Eremiobacteraeota bacterium]MBV8583042.1 hypothetical protein [Candidatus Eremiobacteraeota bacterium]
MKRLPALLALALLAGCAGTGTPVQLPNAPHPSALRADVASLLHGAVGFSVDTPARAATAAGEGVTSTILYGGPPTPNSSLEKALAQQHISVIDGFISGVMFYWECHRTHTVAPPPKSYGKNTYCRTDENPRISSDAAALRVIGAQLDRDAKHDYIVGYWVLDDWAWWDSGSGRDLLQKVHALIVQKTPGRPAICGFGAGIGRGTHYFWDTGTGRNYSNGGCDMVGWYNYSNFGITHPESGNDLNWAMVGLLPAMAQTLGKYGWQMSQTPLMGIGQAWGGRYESRYYQPGLSTAQMQTQAAAFCKFGATTIAWYAWDDSGYVTQTQTPNNSPAIAQGIKDGLAACRGTWGS